MASATAAATGAERHIILFRLTLADLSRDWCIDGGIVFLAHVYEKFFHIISLIRITVVGTRICYTTSNTTDARTAIWRIMEGQEHADEHDEHDKKNSNTHV